MDRDETQNWGMERSRIYKHQLAWPWQILSDKQASLIPFVPPVTPEPGGFGSLFTTHGLCAPSGTVGRASFLPRYYKRSTAYEDGGGGWGRGHALLYTWPFWVISFADKSLLGRGGGWFHGLPPSGNPSRRVCRYPCQLYLAFVCQLVCVEVNEAMQIW